MLTVLLSWLLVVGIAVLFGWLAWRAWRSRNTLVKWGGTILGGLLALILVALSVAGLIGMIKFYKPYNAPIPDLQVAGTPEQIARGEYLANSFCTGCHSVNGELPLTGGLDLGKDIPIPLGSFVSVNLTPAGPLKEWSDGEIFRVLRNGIDRDGRRLAIMSTVRARNMSDEDLHAIIAYLRSQPGVVNETLDPPDRPNLLAAIMSAVGLLPEGQPPITGAISAPPKGATAEYGGYIMSYQDCRDCHGEDLRGGVQGQLAPIGPNLAVVKGWTQEQFITTLRTGVDPSGHSLSDQMPWRSIGRMDDEDLTSIHIYLTGLP